MNNDKKIFESMKDKILQSFYSEVDKITEKITFMINNEMQNSISEKVNVTGNLKASITHKVIKISYGYLIRNFSSADYAGYINDGTKPHRPPIEPIINWVKKKRLLENSAGKHLGLGKNFDRDLEVRGIAQKIAWKISRKGTQGIKFFETALRQAMPKIEDELKDIDIKLLTDL